MTGLTPAQKIKAEAKEATRRALLEAGLVETVERGGDIPSVDAIVTRAGFTRGAFYFYFDDRGDYVTALLEWVLTDIAQSLFASTTAGAADLQEVITRFNDAIAAGEWPDIGGDLRAGYLAVMREIHPGTDVRDQHAALMTGIIDALEALVREGQESSTVRDDIDAPDLARLLLLTAIGSIMWDDIGISIDNRAMGRTLVALLEPRG